MKWGGGAVGCQLSPTPLFFGTPQQEVSQPVQQQEPLKNDFDDMSKGLS